MSGETEFANTDQGVVTSVPSESDTDPIQIGSGTRAHESIWQSNEFQNHLDSLPQPGSSDEDFRGWMNTFLEIAPRGAQDDSRVDTQDWYWYRVQPDVEAIRRFLSGPTLIKSDQARLVQIVANFNALPRRINKGGGGAEGEVSLYANKRGELVSAVKKYEHPYNEGSHLSRHIIPQPYDAERDLSPAETARKGSQEYCERVQQRIAEMNGGKPSPLHPWMVELQLRRALASHPDASKVLVNIWRLKFDTAYEGRSLTPEFQPNQTDEAYYSMFLPLREKGANVALEMEAVPPQTMKLSQLTPDQSQSAVIQWADFLHGMAQVGMVNVDKPHAEIIPDNGDVRVRTYDMGVASAISSDKQMQALELFRLAIYRSVLSAMKKIDALEKELLNSVGQDIKGNRYPDTLYDLLRRVQQGNIPADIQQLATRVSNDINAFNSSLPEEERSQIRGHMQQMRNAVQRYVDVVMPVAETGSSAGKTLGPFLEAFNLPCPSTSGEVEKFAAFVHSSPPGVVWPFLKVVEAYLVDEVDTYADLITIFYNASRPTPIPQESDVQSTWQRVKHHIAGAEGGDSPVQAGSPPKGPEPSLREAGQQTKPEEDTYLPRDFHALESQLNAVTAERDNAVQMLHELAKVARDLQDNLSHLVEQLQVGSSAMRQVEELTSQLAARDRQIQAIARDLRAMQEHAHNLQQALDLINLEQVEDRSDHAALVDALSKEIVTLRAKLETAQKQLIQQQREYAETHTDIAEVGLPEASGKLTEQQRNALNTFLNTYDTKLTALGINVPELRVYYQRLIADRKTVIRKQEELDFLQDSATRNVQTALVQQVKKTLADAREEVNKSEVYLYNLYRQHFTP